MSESLRELKSLTADQPANPLRPAQIKEYQTEHSRLKAMLNAPSWQGGVDRGAVARQAKQIERQLREHAPKHVTDPIKRDKIAKHAQAVMEDVIRPSMLTEREMRRNPSGAVDHYMRREGSEPIKDAVMTWKRALRALHPDNDERDYTNVERFRRSGAGARGEAASFSADAQLPGNFAMSPLAKENWPLGDPTVETPLKAARKRDYSPEAKDAMVARAAKARAALAAKRAAAQAAAPANEAAIVTPLVDPIVDDFSLDGESGGEG